MKNLSRVIVILFLLPLFTFAANPLDIVINEIAWMGTEISYNDEWIELYNNTPSPINLDGWILKAVDGTPEINLTGVISANGFYLLERTDDNTLPEIKADLIYKGVLGNSGEILELFDNFGNLIDKVDSSSGWFTGDNKTKQTMERKSRFGPGSDPGNWQMSQNPGGTPKAKNSLDIQEESLKEPELEPEPQPETQPQQEPEEISGAKSPQLVYPSGIIINEILPSPTGPDEQEEWIEIFNQNDFEVDLSGWKIQDTSGAVTTYAFPENTKISPQGFSVLSRPIAKITLNNDGDGLNLIQPDGKIIDSVSYEKAPQGESYNRADSGWAWSATLTPGSANIIPAPISETKEIKQVKKPTFKEEAEKKRELAAVGEQIPKEASLVPLLIALAIAIFSGAIILILKKKLKTSYYKNI